MADTVAQNSVDSPEDLAAIAYLELVQQSLRFAQNYAKGGVPSTPHYLANVFHRNELSVHFRWKADAGHLIARNRPNEPHSILTYRVSNYEQPTFAVAYSVLNSIKGTLSNEQIFKIQWPEIAPTAVAADETLEVLLTEKAKAPNANLVEYFWNFIAVQCLLDPNGYVAMVNDRSDAQFAAEAALLADPTEASQWRCPRSFFIPSSHVLEEGHDYMFCKGTEVEVITFEKTNYQVPVFWYFTEDITFNLRCTGAEKGKNNEIIFIFDVVPWDTHKDGMACHKPTGIVADERVYEVDGQLHRHCTVMEFQDVGFYLSYLALAVPDLNRAVKILSDLESGLVTSLFPIRTIEKQTCPSCNGEGVVPDKNAFEEVVKCGTCGGEGKVLPTGPHAILEKMPNERGEINQGIVFTGPSTEPFDFAWKMYHESILAALRAVAHGSLKEASGNANETARAKEIDMMQKNITISDIGKIIYGTLQWYLNKANALTYGKYLNSDDLIKNRATVVPPLNYDLTLMADLFEQIKTMSESHMPPAVRKIWAKRAVEKHMGQSPTARLAAAYLTIDKYALMAEDEVIAANGRYIASDEGTMLDALVDLYIHDNVEYIVMQLIEEHNTMAIPQDFLQLHPHVQLMLARKYAEGRVKLARPATQDPIRDNSGKPVGNDSEVDIEAPDDTSGATGEPVGGSEGTPVE